MKVKTFADFTLDTLKESVETFLNSLKGVQIVDITWFSVKSMIVCAITYFTVYGE